MRKKGFEPSQALSYWSLNPARLTTPALPHIGKLAEPKNIGDLRHFRIGKLNRINLKIFVNPGDSINNSKT